MRTLRRLRVKTLLAVPALTLAIPRLAVARATDTTARCSFVTSLSIRL
jgi:hypothetical protein